MKVRFYDPHPDDGTGPGVKMPALAKTALLFLSELGESPSLEGTLRALANLEPECLFSDQGDYIQLDYRPNHPEPYPRHHWRWIRYEVLSET